MTGPGPSYDRGGVGTAAEEAAKLFDALQDWARRAAGGAGERVATGAPECRLCPLCQLLGVLRDTRPEVFAHLAEAGSALVAALRALVEAHEHDWTARRPAAYEHIDIH